MPIPAIPRYALYAEPAAEVEHAFLHIETIPQRSRLHDWTIRAHAHPEHHQLILLSRGAATARLEERAGALQAPALVFAAALTVHEFAFEPGSDGYVITVARPYFDATLERDGDLAAAFAGPGWSVQAEAAAMAGLLAAFGALVEEFTGAAPGRRVAIGAILQGIVVMAMRLHRAGGGGASGVPRADAALVVRYRALIEQAFRQQPGLAWMGATLGVTPARLNAACRAVTGRSALMLLHDRIIIEAKRGLLYSGQRAAEIGQALGFADPAYFNRFFARRTGVAPGTYRKRAP